MDTNVRLKRKLWIPFIRACKSQWIGGGKRYALGEEREFTDLVCEAGGKDGDIWIGQNIIKYVGEIINAIHAKEPLQEVNFFKIAVYAFIWWIKQIGIRVLSQKDQGEKFSSGSRELGSN